MSGFSEPNTDNLQANDNLFSRSKSATKLRHMQQLCFNHIPKAKTKFGGDLLKGNPKRARPLSTRRPLHVILKTTRSVLRLPKNFKTVEDEIRRVARRTGVRLYDHANVGNHLHLLLKISSRTQWLHFIRVLTGRLAQQLHLEWLYRPFTRILGSWRRDYQNVINYIELNRREGELSRIDKLRLRQLTEILGTG